MNNAGIRRVGDIELIPLEQMKRVAEVNLYGTVRDTKAFIPLIRKSKGNPLCLHAHILLTPPPSIRTFIVNWDYRGSKT